MVSHDTEIAYEWWLKPYGLNVGYSTRFTNRDAATAFRDARGLSPKHYSIRMWRVERYKKTCAVKFAMSHLGGGQRPKMFSHALGEYR